MTGLGAKVCSNCKLRFKCPIVMIIFEIDVMKLIRVATISTSDNPYRLHAAFRTGRQSDFRSGVMYDKFKDNRCLHAFGTNIRFDLAEPDEDGTIGYEFFRQQNIFYIEFENIEAGRLARDIMDKNLKEDPHI